MKIELTQNLKIQRLVHRQKFAKLARYLNELHAVGYDIAGVPFSVLDRCLAKPQMPDWTELDSLGRLTVSGQPVLYAGIVEALSQGDVKALNNIAFDQDAHPMSRFEAMGWVVFCQNRAPLPDTNNGNLDVVQFWDTDAVPNEIIVAVNTWKQLGKHHQLFSEAGATDYIHQNFGRQAAAEFSDLGHPALKSDLFRLYYLASEGGLYCDADGAAQPDARDFLGRGNDGVWAASMTNVPNCVTLNGFFAAPKNAPLVEGFLHYVLENIRAPDGRGIFWLSGPGALTFFLFRNIEKYQINLMPNQTMKSHYFKQFDAPYKHTDLNWRVFEKNQGMDNSVGLAHVSFVIDQARGAGFSMPSKMPSVQNVAALRHSAKGRFEKLAQASNLNPALFRCGKEWIKDDPNRLHIVQRYDADGLPSVILKQAARPQDNEQFNNILAAHRLAYDALSKSPTAGVPMILAVNETDQAYLMEFVSSKTLLDLCRATDDHTEIMRAAGHWMSAYHAGTFEQDRAFQPKFMARHARHLVEQMERGERRIDGQKRFVHLVQQFQEDAATAEGQMTKVAAKHGDLNAHNILISGKNAYALDFLALSYAPVGYDIARFLLSYAQMVGDVDKIPRGGVLAPEVADAFWSGYNFIERTDRSVNFLLKSQILMEWNRMPKEKNLSRELRFARLKKIARKMFG